MVDSSDLSSTVLGIPYDFWPEVQHWWDIVETSEEDRHLTMNQSMAVLELACEIARLQAELKRVAG